MAKLEELLHENLGLGRIQEIYLLIADMYEMGGSGVELYGIFMEEHKAKRARRQLIAASIELGQEEYQSAREYWSDTYKVVSVQTGLINYGANGFVIDMIDEFKGWRPPH